MPGAKSILWAKGILLGILLMLMISLYIFEDLYLNLIPAFISVPSEFGDLWSVEQEDEQFTHYHGAPAHR